MKRFGAFLSLVRWPNLVFIILTQAVFYFCIYQPLFGKEGLSKAALLIAASVFIAAAGYIINDYFDLNIDQINKPGKNVFVRTINRRSAIIWHFSFSVLGLLLTMLAVGFGKWYLILANAGCVALLWLYSTSLKKKLLLGNILISLLTAWTILIFFFAYTRPHEALISGTPQTIKFFRTSFLYAGFAFIISLIREAVKDMEDMKGDERYGCRTLPIVAGIRAAKIYTAVWAIVLVATVTLLQLYILQFRWWPAIGYSLLFVLAPLIVFLKRLMHSYSTADFSWLSAAAKAIMLTGILSMIFFRLYF